MSLLYDILVCISASCIQFKVFKPKGICQFLHELLILNYARGKHLDLRV